MLQHNSKPGAGFVVLCITLIAAILFVIPAQYPQAILVVSAVLFGVICWAVWSVAGAAVIGLDDEARSRATAGILLILPFALFAWMPGFGPPNAATDAQNQT